MIIHCDFTEAAFLQIPNQVCGWMSGSYTCNSNPMNLCPSTNCLFPGNCVLLGASAMTACIADPQCGGLVDVRGASWLSAFGDGGAAGAAGVYYLYSQGATCVAAGNPNITAFPPATVYQKRYVVPLPWYSGISTGVLVAAALITIGGLVVLFFCLKWSCKKVKTFNVNRIFGSHEKVNIQLR